MWICRRWETPSKPTSPLSVAAPPSSKRFDCCPFIERAAPGSSFRSRSRARAARGHTSKANMKSRNRFRDEQSGVRDMTCFPHAPDRKRFTSKPEGDRTLAIPSPTHGPCHGSDRLKGRVRPIEPAFGPIAVPSNAHRTFAVHRTRRRKPLADTSETFGTCSRTFDCNRGSADV